MTSLLGITLAFQVLAKINHVKMQALTFALQDLAMTDQLELERLMAWAVSLHFQSMVIRPFLPIRPISLNAYMRCVGDRRIAFVQHR